MSEFQISRSDYTKVRVVETHLSERDLNEGEVLVKIDRFAFTANNMTYAVVGDKLGYWQFFPPSGDDTGLNTEGWGVLPVWGFADVVVSRAEGVNVGERLFGYFPPASHLKMKPVHINAARWIDGSAHRTALPVGYNVYRRVVPSPDKSLDEERALLAVLFLTSYCIVDFLLDHDWYRAKQIIVISASSKTSIGVPYAFAALAPHVNAPRTIGLTSNRNLAWTKQLGAYDSVLTYGDIARIEADVPTVIVDMSGNGALLGKLHKHLGDNMKFCSNIGATHWENGARSADFNKERSEMFFAPSHIQKRIKDWGNDVFEQRTGVFLQEAIAKSRGWLKLSKLYGLNGLMARFDEIREGRIPPEEGLIVEM